MSQAKSTGPLLQRHSLNTGVYSNHVKTLWSHILSMILICYENIRFQGHSSDKCAELQVNKVDVLQRRSCVSLVVQMVYKVLRKKIVQPMTLKAHEER